jgi:hypothetical protein
MATATDNWKAVECTKTPSDQCVAVVTFGAKAGQPQPAPGCWTPNR